MVHGLGAGGVIRVILSDFTSLFPTRLGEFLNDQFYNIRLPIKAVIISIIVA